MSVTFANVSAVNIPQGDVSKITETTSGRVLWEKQATGYPRYFMLAETTIGKFATVFRNYYAPPTYFASYSPPSGITQTSSLGVNSVLLTPTGAIQTSTYLSTGNKFTACYVTSSSDETNIPTTAKKLTDAKWKVTRLRLRACTQGQAYTAQGYDVSSSIGIDLPASQIPITFSGTSGTSISITSITSPASYRSIYEGYSGDSRYLSKTTAPYLYGAFGLGYTSTSLETLAGGMSSTSSGYASQSIFYGFPDYSPTITFFFVIQR